VLPVATPVAASIVATPVALLDHVNVAVTGCPSASAPIAVNCCVAFAAIVADDGATVIVASGPTTTPPLSLHAPNVFAVGPDQPPFPSRWSDMPRASLPASLTPMSTDVVPFAGPPTAAKVPSYERNSMTLPPASTSAMPSGA